MATQTLNDVTRNYDDAAIAGLLNGEGININNSNLIINSDSRWAQQGAVMGSVTISTTLGGTVTIDGRDVWWIPFDAATGVVPALGVLDVINVTGSIAGLGEFLGIFSATGIVPLTAGASIPSTGFIKLRKKTANFVDNEVITLSNGATLTINSTTGGRRGWIHVVGAELSSIAVPRLGKLTTIGDYFELGVTNGSDDQTFQYPIADNCPGIQIETAVGSGVYEWWANAGDRWGNATQYVATDERGKFFGCVNSTGVITIAQRVTNACGFKPVSGLRVRIPNIITSSANSTDWNVNNIQPSTITSRYDLTTTSGGEIDIQHLCGGWYISCVSAFSASLKNSALLVFQFSNLATKGYVDNVVIGLNAAIDNTGISMTSLMSGLDFRNVRAIKYSSIGASNTVIAMTDINDLTIDNLSVESFGSATTDRGSASAKSITITRCSEVVGNNIIAVCGTLSFQTCNNVILNNFKFAEKLNGTTTNISGSYAMECTNSSSDVFIDGYTPAFTSIANLHPYFGIINIAASSIVLPELS